MQRLIKGVGKIIAEELGREKENTITEKSQIRLEELLRENESDSEVLKKHTYHKIYPAIAIYETMLAEGIDSEKSVWYIHEYYQRMAGKLGNIIQGCLKIPGLYHKVPAIMEKRVMNGFPEEAGFTYKWWEKKKDGIVRFDITSCPYADTCKRYGHSELTPVFCDGDDAGYGNMHPNLKWGRTKTIGRGAECCDFKLTDTSKVKQEI